MVERTRVGLVTYSDVATVRFHLNRYTSKLEVLTAIAFTQEKGRTNTAGGIDEMTLNMFSAVNGDRAGDPNTAIVITDGRSNINRQRTIPAAEDARRHDVEIYAIGKFYEHFSGTQARLIMLNRQPNSIRYLLSQVLSFSKT